MLGWFCSSEIVIHSQSPQLLHQSSSAGQGCCTCHCASCPEACQGPLPLPWAGSWPGCAAGPTGLGTALSVPVSVLAQGHTVWLPGVPGARPAVPSFPESPHQPVYPHPLLAWGPSATPQSWCQSGSSPGGQGHPGWAHEGWQSCDLQVSPPLCSLELCSVCVGAGALPALGALSFGVSACPAAGLSAGGSHLALMQRTRGF